MGALKTTAPLAAPTLCGRRCAPRPPAQRSGRCAVVVAAACAAGDAAAAPALLPAAAGRPLETAQQHDVVQLSWAGAPSAHTEAVAVVQGWDSATTSAVVLRQGVLTRLARAAGTLQLTAEGSYLSPASPVVRAFPELQQILPRLEQAAGSSGSSVPGAPAAGRQQPNDSSSTSSSPAAVLEAASIVSSLQELQAAVAADAAPWRDGTAPGAPPKSWLEQALFTAGELAALVAGQRGLVLVQLWNGWDASKGQPLLDSPLALHMLEVALAAPGVAAVSAVAPGGVGLTGILYAHREPYASWAAHLASFGCQANAVAGSAYYKLLIGQLLGYDPRNVAAYVAASGEPASLQLQQQVADDIRKLSAVKPRLPWSPSDADIVRPKRRGGAGGKGSSGKSGGFGARGKSKGAR